MLYVDGGYLAYQILGDVDNYFKPWEVVEQLCNEGAIICIDSSTSIRRQHYPWYKSNRESVNPEFDNLREQAHQWRTEVVHRYPDCCRAAEGLEADDLIGLFASPGDTVLSQDKDMLQLPGVNLIDFMRTSWDITRMFKYSKALAKSSRSAEAFLAYQLCVGDNIDTIPRLLHTKDRSTLPTIFKYEHPLQILLTMINMEQAKDHLNCLLIPTPLGSDVDAMEFVKERYGFDY